MTKQSTFFQKKLLPAVTLDDPGTAVGLAEALLEGGLDVMEITFRTSATAESISAIADRFPEMNIGAGTILSPGQIVKAKECGAGFGLAPGLNEQVVRKAKEHDLPFVPGVSTPTEVEKALELGFELVKLFPVSQLGGTGYIRSLEGPYGHTGIKFLPMGGIDLTSLKQFLECNSVLAAGGSWMTPAEWIKNQEFNKITELVRESLELVGVSGL